MVSPFLLLSTIVSPYLILTKSRLQYNVISSIIDSDVGETVEFLATPFFLKFALLSLAIIAIPFVLCRLRSLVDRCSSQKLTRIYLIIPALLLSLFAVLKAPHDREELYNDGLYRYFPLRQVVLVKRSIVETRVVVNQYQNMSLDLSVARDKENDVSVVLVVGEAARRKSMGVYGAAFNTTPFLSSMSSKSTDQVALFSDAVTVAPFTRVAVPLLLSMAGARDYTKIGRTPSIYKILNQAGVISTLVSKNHGVTLHEQLIDVIVKDNANAVGGASIYDVDLLAHMSDALAESDSGSDFITLRLLGSHQRYKDRYPSDHDCFSPDTPEANYLSSIRYTDADRHG